MIYDCCAESQHSQNMAASKVPYYTTPKSVWYCLVIAQFAKLNKFIRLRVEQSVLHRRRKL